MFFSIPRMTDNRLRYRTMAKWEDITDILNYSNEKICIRYWIGKDDIELSFNTERIMLKYKLKFG